MANPVLVAAAIIVPVVAIGVGGGYWYYKADRVVASGEHRGYSWRVRRAAMQYYVDVREASVAGPPLPWSAVLGTIGGDTSPWSTEDLAKAEGIGWIDGWLGSPQGLGASTVDAPAPSFLAVTPVAAVAPVFASPSIPGIEDVPPELSFESAG